LRTLVASEGFNPMRTKCRAQKSKIGSQAATAAQKDGKLCVCFAFSAVLRCNYFRACCCRALFFSNQNEALRVPSAHPTDAPNSDLMVATVFTGGQI